MRPRSLDRGDSMFNKYLVVKELRPRWRAISTEHGLGASVSRPDLAFRQEYPAKLSESGARDLYITDPLAWIRLRLPRVELRKDADLACDVGTICQASLQLTADSNVADANTTAVSRARDSQLN